MHTKKIFLRHCPSCAEGKAGEQNDSDEWDDVEFQEILNKTAHFAREDSPLPADKPEASREESPPAVRAKIELSSDDDSVVDVDKDSKSQMQEHKSGGRQSKKTAADQQTNGNALRTQDNMPDGSLQSAKEVQETRRAKEANTNHDGEKEKTNAGAKADTAENQISPFKAKKAQQNPITKGSSGKKKTEQDKEQKGKAEHAKKGKKTSDPSAKPQSSKQAKDKSKKDTSQGKSKEDEKAAAEIHEARLRPSGAEPSHSAAEASKGRQHTEWGSLPAKQEAKQSSDAGQSSDIESGKAVQPNGKLRAFANPDELPETKNEKPHIEPTGDMPITSTATAANAAQEAGKAVDGGKSMDQLQDQARPKSPQLDADRKNSDSRDPERAEATESKHAADLPLNSAKGNSGNALEDAEPSTAQGLHNPDPSAGRQQNPPPKPAPDNFSEFAAAVDTATPVANGASAGPPPESQATAGEQGKEAKKRPGLRPIPDSTMLDPDPEAGSRQNRAYTQRGGPPRGLRPIPDSSTLEPGSPGMPTIA